MDGELNPNLSERINRLRPDGLSRWLLLVPSAVLVALFALPLAALVWRSLGADFFSNAFSEQGFLALRLSLITSTISTLVAIVLGTPLAYVMARGRFRNQAWLEVLVDLPIVLPP